MRKLLKILLIVLKTLYSHSWNKLTAIAPVSKKVTAGGLSPIESGGFETSDHPVQATWRYSADHPRAFGNNGGESEFSCRYRHLPNGTPHPYR